MKPKYVAVLGKQKGTIKYYGEGDTPTEALCDIEDSKSRMLESYAINKGLQEGDDVKVSIYITIDPKESSWPEEDIEYFEWNWVCGDLVGIYDVSFKKGWKWTFAQHLKQARKRAGISTDAFAEKMCVSIPTVYAWEGGNRRMPKNRLSRLAKVLPEMAGVPLPEERLTNVGEKCYLSKLKDRDVLSILDQIKAGDSVKSIAEQYGVSVSTIEKIRRGVSWKELTKGIIDDEFKSKYCGLKKAKNIPVGCVESLEGRVRHIREKLGLTRVQFGERVGVGEAIVADWETGKRTISSKRLYYIYKYVASGWNMHWLLTGDGPTHFSGRRAA